MALKISKSATEVCSFERGSNINVAAAFSRWLNAMRAVPMLCLYAFVLACGGSDTVAPMDIGPPVSSVIFKTSPNQFMIRGSTQQLLAETRDASGAIISGRQVVWGSSDSSVATVSLSGLVTAVNAGYATISASSEGRYVSFPLQASDYVDNVSVDYAEDIFELGSTHQLAVRVKDTRGTTIPNAPIMWSSSAAAIVTVTTSGRLSIAATTNDSVVLTASVGGKSDSFRFFAWPSLSNDVPVSVRGTTEESRWFLVRVAPGAERLAVSTMGGTGDADLFLWSPGTWEGAIQMCESISPNNVESCSINNPQPGLWSIELFGYSDYENVELKAATAAAATSATVSETDIAKALQGRLPLKRTSKVRERYSR